MAIQHRREPLFQPRIVQVQAAGRMQHDIGQCADDQRLFSRIVPTVKDIGLWSPRVQAAFADMGAIEFAHVDVEAQFAQDQKIAEEFDARRVVMESIESAQAEARH